jgi:hypothetical protein
MVNILLSSLPFLFSISNTDIDRTLPLWQWDRWQRYRIFGWYIAKQHGEYFFSSNVYDSHYNFITQMLATLDLDSNKIGDDGAIILANIFQNNKVN